MPSSITFLSVFVSVHVMQGHPEAWGDAHGPPKKDHDQRPTNEGAGPQQERAISARITPPPRFLLRLLKSRIQVFYKV